jgi:hypothetical protein
MDGLPSHYDGFKFTSLTKMDFLKMKFEVKKLSIFSQRFKNLI